MKKEQWDFANPDEIEKTIERNKKLAAEGFEIKESLESLDSEIDKHFSKIEPKKSSILVENYYKKKYYNLLEVVKELIDELIEIKKDK